VAEPSNVLKVWTSRSGKEVLIRKAGPADASRTLPYQRSILTETEYFIKLPEEVTQNLEQEAERIRGHAEDPAQLFLLAETEGRLVGHLRFEPKKLQRISHSGEFGISIVPDFRDQGLGRVILELFLEWAVKAPGIKKVCLEVNAGNERAIRLYERFGFEREGYLKKSVSDCKGGWTDTVLMAKWVKD